MEAKETLFQTRSQDRMIEDTEFYKYIFKKTEKIVCAVFYILRTDTQYGQNDTVHDEVERAATALLDVSLLCLKGTRAYAGIYARDVQHALITLESRLRIAHASRLLREGYLEVFLSEIDTVQRTLRKYLEAPERNPFTEEGVQSTPISTRKSLPQKRTEVRREEGQGMPVVVRSRRERILDIIKDRGEATIKDISTIVTDCSEKTIQRELIDMIKDNVILRDGERRWSKYKLI
jgi:hypothetical protein